MNVGIARMRQEGIPVQVEPYPAGAAGIEKSLSVALPLIRDGRHDVELKNWGTDKLRKCGLDGRTPETLDIVKRITCLLDAFRANTTYAPHPIMTETIVKPRAVLCLGKVCVPGVDCGSLAGALGAVLSSHGMPIYAVRQIFGRHKDGTPKQEHLLLGTILDKHDGSPRRYLYIDPSTNEAPYEVSRATEERWISPFEEYKPAGLAKQGVEFVTLGAPDWSGYAPPPGAAPPGAPWEGALECSMCRYYAWSPEMGPAVDGHHPNCPETGRAGLMRRIEHLNARRSPDPNAERDLARRQADQLGLARATQPRQSMGAMAPSRRVTPARLAPTTHLAITCDGAQARGVPAPARLAPIHASGLGIVTPADVLGYRSLWDSYVMGTARAALACSIAAGNVAAQQSDPALKSIMQSYSANMATYSANLQTQWNLYAGWSAADIVLEGATILKSFQSTVQSAGDTRTQMTTGPLTCALTYPDPAHPGQQIQAAPMPDPNAQASVISQLEGLGILAAGVLQVFVLSAAYGLQAAGSAAQWVAQQGQKVVQNAVSATDWLTSPWLVVGLGGVLVVGILNADKIANAVGAAYGHKPSR